MEAQRLPMVPGQPQIQGDGLQHHQVQVPTVQGSHAQQDIKGLGLDPLSLYHPLINKTCPHQSRGERRVIRSWLAPRGWQRAGGGKERDRRLIGISLVKDELVRFPVVGGRIGGIVSPGRSIDRPGSLPDRYVPPEKGGPAPIPSALAQHCTGCFGGESV